MCKVEVGSRSSMIPLHQDCTHAAYVLLTQCLTFYYSYWWEDSKEERGRKRRDWEVGWQLASELRYPWNTRKVASPHPKFLQGLSKLLSRTLDYCSLDGNLEMLHSKFLPWQKAELSLSSGKCTVPVWGLLLSKIPEDKVKDVLLLGSGAPQRLSW